MKGTRLTITIKTADVMLKFDRQLEESDDGLASEDGRISIVRRDGKAVLTVNQDLSEKLIMKGERQRNFLIHLPEAES